MIAPVAHDSGGDGGDEAAQPDESWLNADIEAWAVERGIVLGDARRKRDMLAVIGEALSG